MSGSLLRRGLLALVLVTGFAASAVAQPAAKLQGFPTADAAAAALTDAVRSKNIKAIASMFANRTLGDQSERSRTLRSGEREILVVAGAADRVVPLRDVARVRALLPRHRYLEIQEAEHNLLLTHPERIASALVPQNDPT